MLENTYDRGDELDADKPRRRAAQKAGYSAERHSATFLTRLDERNKDQPEKNGLFASHPDTKERIDEDRPLAKASKSAATVEARYKSNIKYEPTPITAIAVVADGASGLDRARPRRKRRRKSPRRKDSAWARSSRPLRQRSRARRCRLPEAPEESGPIAPPRAAAIRQS